MKKIAVVLAGSGVFDGSEIHEATATLLAINKAGAQYQCIAPNTDQMHTINHAKSSENAVNRNILEESARIARGDVIDIATISAEDFDAIIFPGGFGAAKNLCTFAVDGANASVNEDVKQLTLNMHAQKKPIGAICIAPALIAKIFDGSRVNPEVTIGNDEATAHEIEKTGAVHFATTVNQIHTDMDNKIVTTSAYMLAENIADVFTGVESCVNKVIELI
jgi:enhancing lycopene biosynthesis protein 2